MRLVIQRVKSASVSVDGKITGEIGPGLLVLVGVHRDDTPADAAKLAEKTAKLRIFEDASGKMNLALPDIGGDVLAISQFTLFGDCAKGNRPSFNDAARPETAIPVYETYVSELSRHLGRRVPSGVFGADMQVALVNDGPVTLPLDSRG